MLNFEYTIYFGHSCCLWPYIIFSISCRRLQEEKLWKTNYKNSSMNQSTSLRHRLNWTEPDFLLFYFIFCHNYIWKISMYNKIAVVFIRIFCIWFYFKFKLFLDRLSQRFSNFFTCGALTFHFENQYIFRIYWNISNNK